MEAYSSAFLRIITQFLFSFQMFLLFKKIYMKNYFLINFFSHLFRTLFRTFISHLFRTSY